MFSADGSTHTESNKLYRKVKPRYRPNLSPRQRPTAKSRHDQAALAASAEARGTTHRAHSMGVPERVSIRRSQGKRLRYTYIVIEYIGSMGVPARASGRPSRGKG